MNRGSQVRMPVITGIGMITSLGTNTTSCWDALVAGRTGIRRLQRTDPRDCPVRIGGELPDAYYDLENDAFPRRLRNQTLTGTRLGILCAREAIDDAGFTPDAPECVGVISGCGQPYFQEGQDAMKPDLGSYLILRQMVNAIPGWISIRHGFRGPTFNVAAACASGAFAVSTASDLVRSGRCDAVVAVGLDTLLTYESLMGFSALTALSDLNERPAEASCPFDNRRTGFVLANGGCAVLLEEEECARRRGARIYARLAGYGACSEAYNIVAPESSGVHMARAMSLAMSDAHLAPEDVGYISAHGTSTRQNDAAETAAVKIAFGAHARRLCMSSQKSMTGHTIGGAGAIECGVTALILHHGIVTPTINQREPDPVCDLDYVPNEARKAPELKAALSNSFGFGGHNCTLALTRAS
ncbi:MAG: beta-ketoacyl-[acyl-carrier-protein] synthase family protein [bacterium]